MQRQLDRCGNKRKKFGILGGEKSDIGTYSVNIQRMCREKHKRREREKNVGDKREGKDGFKTKIFRRKREYGQERLRCSLTERRYSEVEENGRNANVKRRENGKEKERETGCSCEISNIGDLP